MTERKKRKYCDIVHPEHTACAEDWRKWRLTYEGGDAYIEEYLRKFRREKWSQFYERRFMTYVPPFAKEGVNEVKNAVFQRLGDVTRTASGGSYVDSCKGLNGGVDRRGSTMAAFLGKKVLPEMLTMRQVGVWIDMPVIPEGATLDEAKGKHPYLYIYRVEAIRSWAFDHEGNLTKVLLEECGYEEDEDTGLPASMGDKTYRLAWIGMDGFVHVRTENEEGEPVGDEATLKLKQIPFVIYEIDHSLLQDAADMQKALLNMESSDVYWCVKANFPIYTEQYDPRPSANAARPAQQAPKVPGFPLIVPAAATETSEATPSGQAKQAAEGKSEELTMGPESGRRYPKDTDRPGFIHPSSEPIKASMEKEQKIKEDIRRTIHLSVAMLDPRMASAESKEMDNSGLQNGLLAIGMALEQGDREVAKHWAAYENSTIPTVRYPEEWTMQSDAGRREDAKALCELKDEIPSITAAKEILKQAAAKLVGHRVAPEVLDKIQAEVDEAQCLTFNIDDLKSEIELRIVSAETASKNRGYPKGEHEKALKEQAEQLKIIALSQAEGAGAGAAADPARGGSGPAGDTGSKDEKKLNANKDGVPKDNTRGEGK